MVRALAGKRELPSLAIGFRHQALETPNPESPLKTGWGRIQGAAWAPESCQSCSEGHMAHLAGVRAAGTTGVSSAALSSEH